MDTDSVSGPASEPRYHSYSLPGHLLFWEESCAHLIWTFRDLQLQRPALLFCALYASSNTCKRHLTAGRQTCPLLCKTATLC